MATNIGEIREKVKTRVQDDAGHLVAAEMAGDIDPAILAALTEYQLQRPRERVAKVQGTGGFDYALDGGSPKLPGWQEGFSDVLEIVHPYAAATQNPTPLDRTEYAVVRLDTGLFLRFRAASPGVAEFFLATYTTAHTIDAATSTVVATDDEALADLAASFAFLKLAARYAQSTDSSIQADAVDRRTKPDIYRSLSGDYRKRYEAKLELGDKALSAAVAVGVIGRPIDATERLFH